LAARALHALSPRAAEPFVRVNCASIPETLFESELFGHERGAFTDARERRIGRFELAHQGTLFLDEVGEVPIHLQAKLLRVLQDKEISRLGGSDSIAVDVRIIAATNRNLQKLVSEGRFREDLLYRLSVIQIGMPSLRERVSDIPILARHLLQRLAIDLGRPPVALVDEAESALCRHSWPGNVRELRNVLERALVLSDGTTLDPTHFPFHQETASATHASSAPSLGSFPENGLIQGLEMMEREWLRQTLAACDGNRTKAAELLRISRPNLSFRLKKLGLESETKKPGT
ncbi:MAG TPA: sigma-54 dependent transcriptional regulator, partial [Candidatus Ozemobacteraceae bacterium]|nr:sigma-54 dependent transcriptional regulator [Candidatus Ozemobacteraceae bacterium]